MNEIKLTRHQAIYLAGVLGSGPIHHPENELKLLSLQLFQPRLLISFSTYQHLVDKYIAPGVMTIGMAMLRDHFQEEFKKKFPEVAPLASLQEIYDENRTVMEHLALLSDDE